MVVLLLSLVGIIKAASYESLSNVPKNPIMNIEALARAFGIL